MKNFITRIAGLALAVCCMVTVTTFATPTVSAVEMQPWYVGIDSVTPELKINSSGQASITVTTQPSSGYSVNLAIDLQRDGKSIKSWTASATYPDIVLFEKTYFVTKGHQYQVVTTATIKNSSGKVVSSPTSSSKSVSY